MRHETRLKPYMLLAHFALNLGARRQSRDRVNDDHVHGVGAHQRLHDLKRLLSGIGLGDEQIVYFNAYLFCIFGIKRVLGIYVCCHAAFFLCLAYDVQSQGGLARAFRTEYLYDPAPRHAPDAECRIKRHGACRNDIHVNAARITKLHDSPFAEFLPNLFDRGFKELCFV